MRNDVYNMLFLPNSKYCDIGDSLCEREEKVTVIADRLGTWLEHSFELALFNGGHILSASLTSELRSVMWVTDSGSR